MKDFEDLPRFAELKDTGVLASLHNCLEELLNCEVKLQCKISSYQTSFNLYENTERTTYFEDEQTVTLLSRIMDKGNLISLFGVRLHGPTVCIIPNNLFNAIGNSLTRVLSSLYLKNNDQALMEIGDRLIKGIISSSIGKGHFDCSRIEYLINYFLKLRSLTLEGAHLQTGIILTKSYFAFNGRNGEDRDGKLSIFDGKIDLIRDKEINKRTWYLADGKTSFFVFSKTFVSNSIYVLNHTDRPLHDYIDQYLMSNTISGMDILIRVINSNHFSIITSSGIEFIYLEGAWHVRFYNKLIKKLIEILKMNENDVKTLLFYIIQLSQKCRSSIIFIPNDDSDYNRILSFSGINILGDVSIADKMYTNTLFRIFASDGVTIISTTGKLIKHGAIVNLVAPNESNKLLGTGHIASFMLGEFGTSIKISSDGKITICNNGCSVKIKL